MAQREDAVRRHSSFPARMGESEHGGRILEDVTYPKKMTQHECGS